MSENKPIPEIESVPVAAAKNQFSLLQLQGVVAAFAIGIGLFSALGPVALVVFLAMAIVAVPYYYRPRWFYVWLLPAVWIPVVCANFRHPGDEYGLFGVGSLAGLWGTLLIPDFNIKYLLWIVLIPGAITVLVFGAVMDKLRVPWWPWSLLLIVVGCALCGWTLSQYPSYARAMAKNGSLAAYVLPSFNLGLYAATLIMVPTTGLVRLVQFMRQR